MHGLNEELGFHGGKEGKTEYSLCGNEYYYYYAYIG